MTHRVQLVVATLAGAAGTLALLATLGFQAVPFEDDEEAVSEGQVPPAALDALLDRAGDAELEALERERRGENELYEGEWHDPDGGVAEATVTADGVLVETEVDVPFDTVPPAVRRTAEARARGGEINYSLRTFFAYDAEFGPEGDETELTIWPTGEIIAEEYDQAGEAKAGE